MLGSVVQIHLSPPKYRSLKFQETPKPAEFLENLRVFCFPASPQVARQPKSLTVFLTVSAPSR